MPGPQCWVTLAESDGDAWKATVLARSIRKTMSSRPVTIAISENVSQSMKVFLQREFDIVLRFDTSEVGGYKGLGKLWLWNMRSWSKCVYVDAASYMLKNSDELFSKPVVSANIYVDTTASLFDVFVFQPDLRLFDELLTLSNCTSGKDDANFILNSKFEVFLEDSKHQIPFSFALSSQCSAHISLATSDPNIVCFDNIPLDHAWKHFTESVRQDWMSTFVHEIVPKIKLLQSKFDQEFILNSLEEHGLPTVNGPAPRLGTELADLHELKEAIAVVGMSCRFPGANNEDEFWNLLSTGQDPIGQFPSDRPRSVKQKQKTTDNSKFEAGFLKCPIDEFDAKFFGISPREAPFVDPQQRVLLEVIWESLENANINPQTLRETNTGVFVGIWQQEYDRDIPDSGLSANEFHHRYLGNAFSATASRISNFLGLYGPNYVVESGCSSSSGAVHLAVQSLRREETALAVASGVNLVLHLFNPLGGGQVEIVAVLSNDFRCKTFDEKADGFVRAEGCGSLVLKRLEEAIRDGDNVIGVIRGTSLNNDGPSTSFGTPNAKAQERVIREALADAGVKPRDVSLVEAHGTGTCVGDPIEVYAIGQVYSEDRHEPLHLCSVKSNIGHSEACAGIAGLIKVLLCLKHQKVPPQLHFENLNSRINLESIPAIIPTKLTDWKAEKRIASVSSFSMSGTNVHLIVQEPPAICEYRKQYSKASILLQMIGISAKSEEALEALCQNYIRYLEENRDVDLRDLAFTLNTGRANMPHRIGIVAKDISQLITKLEKKTYVIGRASTQKRKIVFLFTGQGSQYFGMGKNLNENSSVFQVAFNRCDVLFQKYLKLSLKEVLWTNPSLLDNTIYCQPAIFSLQFCLLQVWDSFGIRPDYVLGHSVGEFCAAVCAGVLTLDDAMKLVVGRSKVVSSLEGGKMLVIKTSAIETRRLIKEFSKIQSSRWIDIAAQNSTEETVVSGIGENVQNFANFCSSLGFKTQQISASHAFHSRQMDSVLNEFGHLASTITFGKLSCSYISGTLAREMKNEEFDANYWIRHLRDTVRFQEAVKFVCELANEGKNFVEIGSQPILLSLVMANDAGLSTSTFCPSLRKAEDDILCLMSSLAKLYVAGIDISWKYWFDKRGKKLQLPTYPFQRQKFWYKDEDDGIPVSPILHPLAGCQLQTPIMDHVFTQVLSTKELPYILDHRVAELVILPAAAYLETIMAAGCHVLQGGRVEVPFVLNDFLVEGALELSQSCQIQTIVHSLGGDEGAKFEIGIYKQISREELDKWKRHAVATFSPSFQTTGPGAILDVKEMQEKMEAIDSIDKAYEAVTKAGIQFGPKFQSIARAWKGERSILTEVQLPENSTDYICHPIVLDAMIQTVAFRKVLASKDKTEIQLQLPVSIKKFTWLSKSFSENVYIFTSWTESESEFAPVSLLNDFGETLAVMDGLELIVTTVPDFLRILKSESNALPTFMEEIWRPTSGITRHRYDPSSFSLQPAKFVEETLATASKTEDATLQTLKSMDILFDLFLLRGIAECHWPWPKVGNFLKIEDWSSIAPPQLLIVNTDKLMKILVKRGFLERISERVFKVLRNNLTEHEVETEISAEYAKLRSVANEESVTYQYTKRCDAHMSNVLLGKTTSISYLFPMDQSEVGALRMYAEGSGVRDVSVLATSVLLDCVSVASGTTNVLRILEVGAGSGICCSLILEGLSQQNISCQYTFTDISPHFLNEAQKRFTKGVTFAIFNIEADPLSQGFVPEEFDFIIATNVIHATENISTTLRNLNVVLRRNGILILGELLKELDNISLTFGFLDGWWRFKDDRQGSPLLNEKQWLTAFEAAGFVDAKTFSMFDHLSGAIVGRKVDNLNNGFTTIPGKAWRLVSDNSELASALKSKFAQNGRLLTDFDFAESIPKDLEGILFMCSNIPKLLDKDQIICEKLLCVAQTLATSFQDSTKPHFVVVTRGVNYIGDAGAGNPNVASTTSFMRSFVNEHHDYPVSVIDLDQDEVSSGREIDELFASIWSKNKEMFKAIREDKVFVQRLITSDTRKKGIPLPNSTRFKITNPPSKSINDLQISVAPKVEPIENQVEIAVRATALNFRDLFLILRPEGFDIPIDADMNPGLDIAGVVTAIGPECTKFQVGDSVIGFTAGEGLASHVVVSSDAVIRKPPQMTFTSAATLPVAFFTVLYSFRECANLQAGDQVLIHVATGGVGLAAIQYAKNVGAEIYATAGSRRKRAYLRSIGINHVYHSRNTSFGDEILRDTGSKGVDVVLNSLTGPNFKEASLKACAPNARFVEIGKVNIWTEEEVRTQRPDVKYFIVELSITAREEPERIVKLAEAFAGEIDKGVFIGLPHETFPMDMIREAFFYFQEAKHIGKIVIRIPESKVSPQGKICFHQPLFHTESTYLITGGLGGIGLEVAKWMGAMGAQNIVLVGRTAPSAKGQEVISNLNSAGCRVVAMQADVGVFQECKSVLEDIEALNLPKLGGIMHAAGVLSDAIIANQTWEKFENVFQPKIYGTWNLHQLTLGLDLEFFTVFSSIVALLGTPGQSNHAAANRFMDSFIHYRNSLGLPGNSVNYGAWSDVGAAANFKIAQEGVYGIRMFTPKQGILSLEKILQIRTRQTAVGDITDWTAVKQIIRLGHYLDEMKSGISNNNNATEEFKAIVEEIKNLPPEKRQDKLEEFLEKSIKETLRIPENEQLDREQNLSEIGVDSLMAMELRNRLQAILGEKQLTVAALQENRTIRSLAAHLASLMNSDYLSIITLETLVAQDSILPPEIQAVTTNFPLPPSQFKEILLTGATGHLGVNFLPALQRQNPDLIIICLVRGSSSEEASQRLQEKIELYSLYGKTDMNKIRVVAGDLSKENFNLPLEFYEALANTVDAIVHCAVKTNHLEEYHAQSEESLRTMNVLATINLLRFATTGNTKPVLYASSLSTVTKTTDFGTLVENFPTEIDDNVNIKNGYSLSKFVSEMLMTQVVERGIPVTIIRYANLAGNSETGFTPTGNNFVWKFLSSCIRVQAFPGFVQNGIQFLPVDTAANISTKIFLQDSMETGVYNLTSSSVIMKEDIKAACIKFETECVFLPFLEWQDVVSEEFDKNELAFLQKQYGDEFENHIQNSVEIPASTTPSFVMNTISEKVKRNCPEFKDNVILANVLLESLFTLHFEHDVTTKLKVGN